MRTIWDLRGNEEQNAIIEEALDRCSWPWEAIRHKLASDANKEQLPVEWEDLSRYTKQAQEAKASGQHFHVHEGSERAHPIERREQVLGLAWYSGKVTLDNSLVNDPELAMEVFLSEGAHMIDFFWMEDGHRTAIWNALHRSEEDVENVAVEGQLDHDHSWFDYGDYYAWVGEAWMGLFVKAYSDIPVTITFDHPPTDEAVEEVRRALTPYFWSGRGITFHDSHKSISPTVRFTSPPEGLSPCGTCKPLRQE